MAIDTDKLRNGGGKGARPTSNVSTPEGGGDMALALTNAIQGQASEMLVAAQAAQISIDHASDQLSDLYAEVFSRRPLLNATMAKTMAKLEAMGGPVEIKTEVAPVTLDLPNFGNFADTRRSFSGLFGGGDGYSPGNPFLVAAATAADEVASDD
jgi:hypothetical protein